MEGFAQSEAFHNNISLNLMQSIASFFTDISLQIQRSAIT